MAYPLSLDKDHEILGSDYCSGYTDSFGKWNTGFYCPQTATISTVFCCGTPVFKYCCITTESIPEDDEEQTTDVAAFAPSFEIRTPVVVGVIFGVAAVAIFLTLVSCFYCSCCILYKKRRAELAGGIYRMQGSSTTSGLINTCASPSTAPSVVTTPLDTTEWNMSASSPSITTSASGSTVTTTSSNMQAANRAFMEPPTRGNFHANFRHPGGGGGGAGAAVSVIQIPSCQMNLENPPPPSGPPPAYPFPISNRNHPHYSIARTLSFARTQNNLSRTPIPTISGISSLVATSASTSPSASASTYSTAPCPSIGSRSETGSSSSQYYPCQTVPSIRQVRNNRSQNRNHNLNPGPNIPGFEYDGCSGSGSVSASGPGSTSRSVSRVPPLPLNNLTRTNLNNLSAPPRRHNSTTRCGSTCSDPPRLHRNFNVNVNINRRTSLQHLRQHQNSPSITEGYNIKILNNDSQISIIKTEAENLIHPKPENVMRDTGNLESVKDVNVMPVVPKRHHRSSTNSASSLPI